MTLSIFDHAQLSDAATQLGWQREMLSALVKKEVLNSPFFKTGGKRYNKILFERHIFWRHLVKSGIDPYELIRRDPTLRDILGQTPYPKKHYGKFITQYTRRDRAAGIHRDAALAACSYTAFQILGENFEECGYSTVTEFVDALESPENWLPAMVALVKAKRIESTLRPDRLDFDGFSVAWNGPDYWRHGYHIELSRLYQREMAASLPRQESSLKAAVQSKTVQRTVATVTAGAAPGAGIVLQSESVSDLVETAKALADKGQAISGQVSELQAQAQAVASQLDWLPWAIGGQWVLIVLLGLAVGWRYLHDRGYDRE